MSLVLPTVSAGSNQTVTDGVPLVLTGVVQQGTYAIGGVVWSKDSGPDCAMIGASLWVNSVFELSAGTYVFRFTAYDIFGNSNSATCTVTVSHTTGPVYIGDYYGTPTTFVPINGSYPPTDLT